MRRLFIAGWIAALALLTFFEFPGHTWLQQDTQIYAPILEHLRDPSLFRNEILVARPHVSFTLYDEAALALRAITGLEFRDVLAIEQVVWRALGIWGFYLIATAAGLAMWPALLATSILSLGATIVGPSVLIFEYEPVPRGFAVPLLFFATGLAAHGRYFWAGVAGSVAFLIHPPTAYPFWGVYFALALWPAKPEIMRRRLYGFAPLIAAILVLWIASKHQAGVGEAQAFFRTLDALQEKLQRMRASYIWIDIWGRIWLPQYFALWGLSLLAYWRIRRDCTRDLKAFLIGLPLIGMLSIPVSYVLLERMKWALIPQFQPMRALLFITALAILTGAAAGALAASRRAYVEALAWFALAYLIPVNTRVLEIPSAGRTALILGLASAAVLAGRVTWLVASVAAAGFFLIPWVGHVENYPHLETAELRNLSSWALRSTPVGAVFLFPDAGRGLDPGIFRAEARRAVYVDWKGGGQVNYLKELGEQWWERWQKTMLRRLSAAEYAALGIQYVVTSPARPLDAPEVYRNSKYVVSSVR